MSRKLFYNSKIGDEFFYRGPMGIFTLPENLEERDIYFVATGSGISPFRSMLGHIDRNKIPTKNLKLFFGTRTEEDIPYYEEMKNYQKTIPNFEYIPCLSQQKWEGHNGYVHSAYLPEITTLDKKPLFYFCGWDKMIREGRGYLDDLGYELYEDIRVEIFG
jgi:NAD(P)H-flavin reductase